MIDTAFKRRSAAAARRMPWMRRFGIAPDGTIDQGDRQAKAWVYGGILAEEEAGPAQITSACVSIAPAEHSLHDAGAETSLHVAPAEHNLYEAPACHA